MKRYSLDEVLELIRNGKKFEGLCFEAGMHLKVNDYKEKVAIAIAGGSNFSEDLETKATIMSFDRWHYEDAYTDYFIKDRDLSILALDSMYEYDLNKRVEESFSKEVAGKKAWKEEVTDEEKQASFAKHRNFYLVIDALMDKLSEQYETINLYSFHSFNFRHTDAKLPLFNLGTKYLDRSKVEGEYTRIKGLLEEVATKESERVEEDGISKGDGYFYEYMNNKHENVNTFSIDIKKVFCDERNGDVFAEKMVEIKELVDRIVD